MTQYYIAKARNRLTGETQKVQDLTGHRFGLDQKSMCQEQADRLARSLEQQTDSQWDGFVELYTPSVRRAQS